MGTCEDPDYCCDAGFTNSSLTEGPCWETIFAEKVELEAKCTQYTCSETTRDDWCVRVCCSAFDLCLPVAGVRRDLC
jgi:hypothetical protein